MIALKINNPVFRGSSTISPFNNNLLQRIYVYDDSLDNTVLKNIVILANFDVYTQTITADFPYTGTWYNLMDNSIFNVSDTSTGVSLAPGEFRIFGNQQATLTQGATQLIEGLQLVENPVQDIITIQWPSALAGDMLWKIFNTSGELISEGNGMVSKQNIRLRAPQQQGMYFVVLNHPQTNAWGLLKVLKQ